MIHAGRAALDHQYSLVLQQVPKPSGTTEPTVTWAIVAGAVLLFLDMDDFVGFLYRVSLAPRPALALLHLHSAHNASLARSQSSHLCLMYMISAHNMRVTALADDDHHHHPLLSAAFTSTAPAGPPR